MNKILISAKINGMWKNGKKNEQRGMNVLLVDYRTVFKTTVWQEDADWAEKEWSIGDEIELVGECSGIWENDNGQAVEISKPEIRTVHRPSIGMTELTKSFGQQSNESQRGKRHD